MIGLFKDIAVYLRCLLANGVSFGRIGLFALSFVELSRAVRLFAWVTVFGLAFTLERSSLIFINISKSVTLKRVDDGYVVFERSTWMLGCVLSVER